MSQSYTLKLTSAVVIGGAIHRAGVLVEMREYDAKALLARGKAVIATVADAPAAPPAPDAEADAPPAPAGRARRARNTDKPE